MRVAVATMLSACTPGTGDAEHGTLDAGGVHHGKPLLAEIGDAAKQYVGLVAIELGDRRRPVVDQAGRQEMFFERDFFEHKPPSPDCL